MDFHYELGGESFVWDERKAAMNLEKHGLRFEEAASVFHDPFFKIVDASRNDEVRDAAIGFDSSARLLFVVHAAVDGQSIRIISARRATSLEERQYAQ